MILNLSEHNSGIQSLIPLSKYGTVLEVAEAVCSLVCFSLNLSRIDQKCVLHRPTAFIWLIFEMTHCDSIYIVLAQARSLKFGQEGKERDEGSCAKIKPVFSLS